MIPIQSFNFNEVLTKIINKGFTRNKLINFYHKFYREYIEVNEIRNVDKDLINFLKSEYIFPVLREVYSNKDNEGNIKIGYQTDDNHIIETVVLTREKQTSICVSTQIGCKMGCVFCATGKLGFVRDLSTWEIVEQVRATYINYIKGRELTHITIMGMGEPFDNFESMYKAFLIFSDQLIYGIAKSKVTVASVGYLSGLKKLLDKKDKPTLVISLHASNQEKREKIMPISRKYTIEEIINFIRNYPIKKNKRISIQYLLLEGINDSVEDAEALSKLLEGLPVKVNFMRYNSIDVNGLKPVSEEKRDFFISYLRNKGFSCIRRRSAGEEIKGACGQLGYSLIN
ncbi:MAG TPA: 23S rRNA (adenine(2503)-C(2))-methyltransferase RlmN [Spirochaetota bacterium]|nr:23S rRNA (adenine(2503)-C(2))-methyltransferase RlmN [Spirochaetota bacterium]HOM38330.1 23S rRNA (adenine(2503)-C(2))-methyltransferase RlmN [Spirochaetota bacterium]HPQ48452.1 23S rRNA (adenine(2503)-C(2))-methyltransferase RlmN [Spirochaetota bacterium]